MNKDEMKKRAKSFALRAIKLVIRNLHSEIANNVPMIQSLHDMGMTGFDG